MPPRALTNSPTFDNNFPGRAGWKEIVVFGDGVAILDSSAPATDRSQELTNYSSDALNSPPQQLSALVGLSTPTQFARLKKQTRHIGYTHTRAERRPVASTVPIRRRAPHAQNTPRSRFTELISTQGKLSFWILFSAALIAAGLGALHALGAGARQDHRRCLSGRFARHGKTCGVAGNRRHRGAHGGRIPVGSSDLLCVAVHRSRAALPMARSNFRPERCRARYFHFSQTLDGRKRRAFPCSGRAAFALVSFHDPAGHSLRRFEGQSSAPCHCANSACWASPEESCLVRRHWWCC